MADMFDYLDWRGDIPFTQVPLGPVDTLLFSALVYIDFTDIVSGAGDDPVPLHEAAEAFFALPNQEDRVRKKNDLQLLRAMAAAPRFRDVGLIRYQSRLIEQVQTQFAAITYLLSDGSAVLTFRGTDMNLIGWKEDFNMTFQDSVPAQRVALDYTLAFAAAHPMIMHLCGHSKGGNLAVYAAAKSPVTVQQRIVSVYNHDGPGFTESLMGNSGYLAMVPKIRTYIPESSIVGMLLEHEEPYTVIKSRQMGATQHDPYHWEILGADFIHLKEVSSGSQFLNTTIKNWLQDMTREERGKLVDTVYDLLTTGGISRVEELSDPKNVLAILGALKTSEEKWNLLSSEILQFLRSAGETLFGAE